MEKKPYSAREVFAFLALTFGLSWLIWIGTAAVFGPASREHLLSQVPGQLVPLISAYIVSGRRSGIRWLFAPKGRVLALLCAFLLPGALTVLGNALYFLLFPASLDPELALLASLLGTGSVSPKKYLLMALVQAVTLGAVVNGIFFLGEEAGFRGFLFPRLRERFGAWGPVIGGCIWGLWLSPLVCLGQYYGSGYPGFPFAGVLAALIFGASSGILLDRLYEKGQSVLLCAVFRGAMSACGALPALLLRPELTPSPILGPGSCMGLIAGLPLTICALLLLTLPKLRKK